MKRFILIMPFIACLACSSVDTPNQPEIQADFTPDDLLRRLNDPNTQDDLLGRTLTIEGHIWRVHTDVSPPFFTLQSSANIQIFLLDESSETYQKLLTRQSKVIVQGIVESFEPSNTIIFTSAVLLN